MVKEDTTKLNNNLENTIGPTTKPQGNTRIKLTRDMINDIINRYTYDSVNGGLINNKTGVQNNGVSVGGRYKKLQY